MARRADSARTAAEPRRVPETPLGTTGAAVRDSDRAYSLSKADIVTGQLGPGTVLNEKTLAARLSIGRTPVREAIQRLTAEGLLTAIPRRGVYVSHVSIREMHETLELRFELERVGIRYAIERGTPADIDGLETILIRGQSAQGTPAQALVDLEFHRAIADAGKNSQLSALIVKYHQLTLRLLYLQQTSHVTLNALHRQHTQILDSIRARDVPRGESMIRKHIDGVRAALLGAAHGGTSVDDARAEFGRRRGRPRR